MVAVVYHITFIWAHWLYALKNISQSNLYIVLPLRINFICISDMILSEFFESNTIYALKLTSAALNPKTNRSVGKISGLERKDFTNFVIKGKNNAINETIVATATHNV